jgi:hypothetical protein
VINIITLQLAEIKEMCSELKVQKPFNQSNFVAKSGAPARKELSTWYQISESNHMISPDIQHTSLKK